MYKQVSSFSAKSRVNENIEAKVSQTASNIFVAVCKCLCDSSEYATRSIVCAVFNNPSMAIVTVLAIYASVLSRSVISS